MDKNSLHSLAVLLSMALLIYHQVTTLVPLFPWNDVRAYSKKLLFIESAMNALLMGTGFICLLIGNSAFTRGYPLIYYPLLFAGECVDWWIPYFSESFAKKRKIFDYDTYFANTLKWIPHRQGKRTPDANHIVLHIMTLATILVVYLEWLST